MKLFYFTRSDRIENFGDSLNPWLWEKFIAQELDDDETTAFVGIGTILNSLLPQRVPQARNFVIFSSGVGYGRGIAPAIDSNWKIYCLRGPLSAQQIGAPASLAVADGGLLIRRVFQVTEAKDCRFSFMPHVEHAIPDEAVWTDACAQAGIRYIDPRWSTEKILSLISRTEILLAEAMHGAIAAEALRVPWIPICTGSKIFAFKWVDWCASLGLKYQPAYVMSHIPHNSSAGNIQEFYQYWWSYFYQGRLRSLRYLWSDRTTLIASQLSQIIRTIQPILCEDHRIESLTTELEERLYQFKQDVGCR